MSPALRDDLCGAQDVRDCLKTPEITRKQASAGKSGSKLPHSKSLLCNIYLLGVGTLGCLPGAPPSEPAVLFSQSRLSSWWFYL